MHRAASLGAMAVLLAGWIAGQTANQAPAQLRNVGIDQKLNKHLPLDVQMKDEAGNTVAIRQYFGTKPVILSFVYYSCPRLCSMQLTGLLKSLRALSFNAGKEFEVLNISFDPREKPPLAAQKKATYVAGYGRSGGEAGWHFLTGEPAAIQRLTNTAGYRFEYDPHTDQYSHASAIMVVTPDGRLSRYFYGIEYSTRDLRLALVEASAGKIGSVVDQALLYCFDYDPQTGKYSMGIMRAIRLGAVLIVFFILWLVVRSLRRERRQRWQPPTSYEPRRVV